MKNLLIGCSVLAALLMGVSAGAQLTNVVVEETATFPDGYDFGGTDNIEPGSITYRIYAELADPEDFVSGVFATPGCSDIYIATSTYFYNVFFAAEIASGINPAIPLMFPQASYDSWLTIGADDSAYPGTVDSSFVNPLSITPSFGQDYNDPYPGESFFASDCIWFAPDGEPNGYPDENNRVLLAQLTTTGTLSFKLNLRVYDDGDPNNVIDYVSTPNIGCASPNEVDGTDLGLIYGGPPACGDPNACNYDPDALPEDINNDFCDFSTCPGCTDPLACNYHPDYPEDDGSCILGSCNYAPELAYPLGVGSICMPDDITIPSETDNPPTASPEYWYTFVSSGNPMFICGISNEADIALTVMDMDFNVVANEDQIIVAGDETLEITLPPATYYLQVTSPQFLPETLTAQVCTSTLGCGTIPDLDGDGDVDSGDLIDFLSNFGCTGTDCPGDFNGDGVVNALDLLILLLGFGG